MAIKKLINKNTIYIGLINLYMFLYLGIVYPFMYTNEPIRLLIIIVMVINVVFLIITNIFIKKKIKISTIYFFIYFTYFFFMLTYREGFNTTAFISTLFFPLVFLSADYNLSKIYNKSTLIKFQIIIFLIFFLLYFYTRLIFNINNGLVINSIYYQLLLLPYILSIKKDKIRFSFVLLLTISALFSAKRTVIIALIVVVAYYIILKNNDKTSNILRSSVKTIMTYLSLLLVLILVTIIIDYYFNLNVFNRLAMTIDDGGSGRLDIVTQLTTVFKSSDLQRITFGYGYNATSIYSSSGLTAHNDFIEVLFNFGILGFSIYLLLYLQLIYYAMIFRKRKHPNRYAFNSSIILFFVLSFSTHLIFVPTYIGYLAFFWNYNINLLNTDEK